MAPRQMLFVGASRDLREPVHPMQQHLPVSLLRHWQALFCQKNNCINFDIGLPLGNISNIVCAGYLKSRKIKLLTMDTRTLNLAGSLTKRITPMLTA